MSMTITNTMMFITDGWFLYGQGDDRVGCFADALTNFCDNADLIKGYPICFDMNYAVNTEDIIDTDEYCICYDDCEDDGQKTLFGYGKQVKTRLQSLFDKDEIEAAWVFPMSKAIKTKELEVDIRNDIAAYNKVAEWIGEEW